MNESNLRRRLRQGALRVTFARIDNSRRTAENAALRPGQVTGSSGNGPYYIPGTALRRDVREDRPGIPLTLRVRVVDVATDQPLRGEVIGDIWHADAAGHYSGYLSYGTERFPALLTMAMRRFQPTDGSRFLRGRQQADSDGLIEFLTIVPGWYTPRTQHIHFKVSHNGKVLVTTELYLPDDVREQVLATPLYASRGPSMFTNNNDIEILIANGSPGSWPAFSGDVRNGYTATVTVRVMTVASG